MYDVLYGPRVPVYKVVRDGSVVVPCLGPEIVGPGVSAMLLTTLCLPYDREVFVVMSLTAKNRVLGLEIVYTGGLSHCMADPRELFKSAILKNASGIILCHNHPSGDPTPSRDDITVTQKLRQSGDLLGVRVVDHVIVTQDPDVWYSFSANGLLDVVSGLGFDGGGRWKT